MECQFTLSPLEKEPFSERERDRTSEIERERVGVSQTNSTPATWLRDTVNVCPKVSLLFTDNARLIIQNICQGLEYSNLNIPNYMEKISVLR